MLGIIGGMGPLASAEFIKTIYEHNRGSANAIAFNNCGIGKRDRSISKNQSQSAIAL